MAGPLSGYRIIELAGIGPGPFAAMMLADMGAEVVRVERAKAVNGPAPGTPHYDVLLRGRRNIAIDLKHPEGVATLLDLVASADGLIEGFRPGVMERLGIGPEVCLERNPRLVFGRMTGWGQSGPLPRRPGHDINYIALAGALAHFGRAGEAPVPPLNMVGDFGGGGMFLAFGVVCALLEAQRSGLGQIVDAAMVDGAAVLMSMFWSFRSIGVFDETQRGTNLLDTGAHFYDVYQCADGEYISIGSIEPQFYAELLRLGRPRRRSRVRQADGQVGVATSQATPLRSVRDKDARRMVLADGGDRRLLRPGADDERGRRAPPQRAARHVRRDRRDPSARAGAEVLADHARGHDATRPSGPTHHRNSRATGASTPPELTH